MAFTALTGMLASLALSATLVPAAPPAQVNDLHECARAAARCDGTLEVPLDWSDPSSERIEVAFTWIPAPGRPAGTILANPGGPQPALPALPRIQQALGPVLGHQNLLVVDPRGLGKSSPLLCPGLNLSEPGTIARCASHLGARARFFTADQAVHDMDAVRRALGAGKITFYGNSYGTVYAQAYAARHPESLAAAFLDSTVTTGADGYASWPLRSRPDLLDVVCDRSPACRALPGEATVTYAELVTRLREHPDPEVPLLTLKTMELMVEPVAGRELNAAATAYLAGDPEPLRRLARVMGGAPTQPIEGAEWAGYLAYRCGDGGFPFDRDAAPAERLDQLERYFLRERPLAPYTPADLGVNVRAGLEFCVDWPTPRHSPVLPPGADLPDVPVMVVGGDFDTHAPAEVSAAMRAFPDATFVRVPFGTHSLAWTDGDMGDCVRQVLRSFVTDHRVPRARCTAESYRAIGAFPRSLGEVKPLPATGLDARRRQMLAAVFATAADAVARRDPAGFLHSRLTEQPGLRGGRVTFAGGSITLDEAAYVPGVPVSGQITLTSEGRATALLDVRAYRVKLSWEAFTTRPELSGTFDGTPFRTRIPH